MPLHKVVHLFFLKISSARCLSLPQPHNLFSQAYRWFLWTWLWCHQRRSRDEQRKREGGKGKCLRGVPSPTPPYPECSLWWFCAKCFNITPTGKISMVVCSYSAQQNMSQKSFFGAMVQRKLFINVVSIRLHPFHLFTHDHQATSAYPCEWMFQEMKSAWTITNFHVPGV